MCNVLNYGRVASKTSDIDHPLTSGFAACKNGGIGGFNPQDWRMTLRVRFIFHQVIMECQIGKHSMEAPAGLFSLMGLSTISGMRNLYL